jgi:hypothetical protein
MGLRFARAPWILLVPALFLSLNPGACLARDLPAVPAVQRPVTLNLKPGTADLSRLLGRQIEVIGYYYGGSIPMIVDDMERVAVNLPLPPGCFVPITGPRPQGLKWGDRVKAQGILRRPGQGDHPSLAASAAVLQIERAEHLSVLRAAAIRGPAAALALTPSASIRRVARYTKEQLTPARKYAVLIAGGGSVDSNHIRYWNDLTVMYDILISYGYQPSDITVIYADGIPPDDSREGKRASDMPVHFMASRGNIRRVFDDLQRVVTPKDTVFIHINDHGGGCLTQRSGGLEPELYGGRIDDNDDELLDRICENSIGVDLNRDGDRVDCVRVDESISLWQSSPMYDDDFAAEVAKVSQCGTLILITTQCFSGGFLDDLTGPSRVLMSAADDVQISRARRPDLLYNEFPFWIMAALSGQKPDGSGSVNADADGDGRVSLGEAYNFAVGHDSTDETPCFEDNGARSFARGAIPAGTEGALGMKTYL